MIIDTHISWGYLELIKIFAEANNLSFSCVKYIPIDDGFSSGREFIRIQYEDNSETAEALTFMSIRHLGTENMLCDYLIRCNVDPILIPIGRYVMKKSNEEIEKEWQEHRKKIGLAR